MNCESLSVTFCINLEIKHIGSADYIAEKGEKRVEGEEEDCPSYYHVSKGSVLSVYISYQVKKEAFGCDGLDSRARFCK